MIKVEVFVVLHLFNDDMEDIFDVFSLIGDRVETVQLLQQTEVGMTKLEHSFRNIVIFIAQKSAGEEKDIWTIMI